MASIAFDVQGTLKGSNQVAVRKLLKYLLDQGHEIAIWSFGGYSMAMGALRELGLSLEDRVKVECMDKIGRTSSRFQDAYDFCVDDETDAAMVLSASKLIYSYDVPENETDFPAYLKGYGL